MLAWKNFLQQQEEELGKETVDKWLRSLKVAHFDACNLYLEAKDSIRMAWFEEHIRPKVKSSFFNNNHHSIKVHLTVAEEAPLSPSKKTKKRELLLPPPLFLTDPLDPLATLEDFVPGANNQIPFQLLQELFTNQETLFNPIYLYGAQGVGKSHLLMSLAHAFKMKELTAIYVRAETFTEHLVSAIRNGTMREFREAYRHTEILLLDDIHHFARRSASQEELFHTFNTLHTSRRQIILAGAVSPQHLEDIEPRLVSRFEWGITLQINKLSKEELKEVLQKRLLALQLSLTDEIQHFLIDRFKNNTHSLIRALQALILRSKDLTIPLQTVELLLKDLIAAEQQNSLTPLKIIHAIADYYGITTDDILGKAQTHECVLPRQIAMLLCRQELQLPFQKIGRLFTRDHSTVITSIKAIQKKIDSQESEILDILERFKSKFSSN